MTDFNGKKVVLTGTLSSMTRNEAKALLIGQGATVTGSLSASTDYLIAGAKAGSKLKRAQSLGVTVLDESALTGTPAAEASDPTLSTGAATPGALRFDGLYQKEGEYSSSYIRLFEDGLVLTVSSTGSPEQVWGWLKREKIEEMDHANGQYTVASGGLTFSSESSSGSVDYSGKVGADTLELSFVSNINGFKGKGSYAFMAQAAASAPKADPAEEQSASEDVDFSGKTVVVTGTLSTMTRNEAKALLQEKGATIGKSVTGSTDILIAGAKAGSKLKRAQSLGITILDESVLTGKPAPPDPVADDPQVKEDSAEAIDFKGKIVVVTGTLSTMTRNEAKALLQEKGATIGKSVTGSTDILIAGAKAGSKLKRAQSLGITILDESALTGEAAPAAPASAPAAPPAAKGAVETLFDTLCPETSETPEDARRWEALHGVALPPKMVRYMAAGGSPGSQVESNMDDSDWFPQDIEDHENAFDGLLDFAVDYGFRLPLTAAFLGLTPLGEDGGGNLFLGMPTYDDDWVAGCASWEGLGVQVLSWDHETDLVSDALATDIDHWTALNHVDAEVEEGGNPRSKVLRAIIKDMGPEVQLGWPFGELEETLDEKKVRLPGRKGDWPTNSTWQAYSMYIIELLRSGEFVLDAYLAIGRGLHKDGVTQSRLEGIGTGATLSFRALYYQWHLYFSGKDDMLEGVLRASEGSPSRLVRDSAAVVRQCLNGRKQVGAIEDIQATRQETMAVINDPMAPGRMKARQMRDQVNRFLNRYAVGPLQLVPTSEVPPRDEPEPAPTLPIEGPITDFAVHEDGDRILAIVDQSALYLVELSQGTRRVLMPSIGNLQATEGYYARVLERVFWGPDDAVLVSQDTRWHHKPGEHNRKSFWYRLRDRNLELVTHIPYVHCTLGSRFFASGTLLGAGDENDRHFPNNGGLEVYALWGKVRLFEAGPGIQPYHKVRNDHPQVYKSTFDLEKMEVRAGTLYAFAMDGSAYRMDGLEELEAAVNGVDPHVTPAREVFATKPRYCPDGKQIPTISDPIESLPDRPTADFEVVDRGVRINGVEVPLAHKVEYREDVTVVLGASGTIYVFHREERCIHTIAPGASTSRVLKTWPEHQGWPIDVFELDGGDVVVVAMKHTWLLRDGEDFGEFSLGADQATVLPSLRVVVCRSHFGVQGFLVGNFKEKPAGSALTLMETWQDDNDCVVQAREGKLYAGRPGCWREVDTTAFTQYKPFMYEQGWVANPSDDDIDALDSNGQTALHRAISDSSIEAIERCVERGANLEVRDPKGLTAFHMACKNGKSDALIKALVEAGADINTRDDETYIGFIWLIGRHPNLKMMRTLIEKGADVCTVVDGWSPLFEACVNSKKPMLELIIAQGPDLTAPGWEGKTPMQWAKHYGNRTAVRVLTEHIDGQS